MRKLFDISDDEETRIWYYYSPTEYDELTKEDSTVQDVGLCEDQLLVIETRSEDGSWNHPPKKYDVLENLYISTYFLVLFSPSFYFCCHSCFLLLNCSFEFMA
jgi:ubiquitin carboxyl-terminal hydrolase 4/11/15